MTSNRALQAVKRLLNAKKAGHTGSLDPAATGMLPLCFGEATKVCAFLLNADKTYRVTARLGTSTDTGDSDGQATASASVPDLSADDWSVILQTFVGESMQIPPMYSALKKDGKRLYELARKGETVERQPRPIVIHEIRLLECAGPRLVFRVACSKGTYIRTLVEDIARRAGTVAHTARLHRETVGHFRSEDMLDLAAIEALAEDGQHSLRERLLPPDAALADFPPVSLDESAAVRFSGGQVVAVVEQSRTGLARVYGADQRFLGVGEFAANGQLAPRRIFLKPAKNPVDI
ncbi:MAG: tRNA pseudouridine(55) synthase TruB [Gammaproteobacteria bacterium]|nr:tRNA pseudouridine(55) synthase TruB [Gammaproteobacteria bacterium]MBT8110035.1 tRNA pseudouridine(55) synthase TruB [Gammaproteobacteria bacterium]